jgi:hypothetical protein
VTAAAGILSIAFLRAWRDARRTKMSLTTLENATSDPAAAGAALGVTHLLREELLDTLPALATRWSVIVAQSRTERSSPVATLFTADDRALALQLIDDINDSQRQLTASIATLAPETARNALNIVTQALLRPKGVRVSGVLQRANGAPGGVGLSFTVNQLQNRDPASHITVWEDWDSAVAQKDVVERLHGLVVPATRALACELLRQELMTKTVSRWTREGLSHLGDRVRAGRAPRRGRYSREAVIDFVIGVVYQEAAHTCAPATMCFYRFSDRALEKAADKLDYYKAPYLRGLTLAELGKREENDEVAAGRLSHANRVLEAARTKLPEACLPPDVTAAEQWKIRALVATNCCLVAERLPDEPDRARRAAAAISGLPPVETCLHLDANVLYSLACPRAVASRITYLAEHGVDLDDCLTAAKRSLLHACLRDDGWFRDASADVDLRALHTWLPRAQRLLKEERDPGTSDTELVEEVIARTALPRTEATATTPSLDGGPVPSCDKLGR